MRVAFAVKPRFILLLLAFFTASGNGAPGAQTLTVSGILDSSVSMRAGSADAPAFSYGLEEYANLRMQARIKDRAVFYGAVNFIAAAGDAAKNAALLGLAKGAAAMGLSPSAFTYGENYVAGIELERLYFRLNGEYTDFDGGLLRLPFGYGQIWGPSDFLNPKNPLYPDARPRAVLGAGLSWYPADPLKLLGFGAAPRNPFAENGGGGLVGLSMDQHWEKASVQALYAFETPGDGSKWGIHRAGMSLKADVELGLLTDLLYTYNREAHTGVDGLSLSLGADYSFFDGKLITLAEYLYSGEASSTSLSGGGALSNRNYLYTGISFLISDYTSASLALISGFDDISFTPVISLEHELFQGCALTLTGQIPLDRDLFADNGEYGELGPRIGGSYFNFNTKVRLRF
jgi:hypothetical protein